MGFSAQTSAVLRDADRKIQMLGAVGDHHGLYAFVRVTMGVLTQVDSFYIAFFRHDQTVVFPYNFDGQEYDDPGIHSYGRDGLGAWLQRHNKPYIYSVDNGRLVHMGYSYGDKKQLAKDCIAAPLAEHNAGRQNVIGVVCVQSYTAGVYRDETVAALQWLARRIVTVLVREREDQANRASLGPGTDFEPADRLDAPTSIVEVIEEVGERLSRLNREIDAARQLVPPGHAELAEKLDDLRHLCQRMRTETAEIMVRPSRDASELLDNLTSREQEIAHLIAEGLSNEEIAAQLVISELTVKTHVSRVLRKFGVRQRSAVAARLRPLG